MKTYWESGGIAPRIHWPRHYMEMSGQLHVPITLPPGKSPWYPLDSRLGGTQTISIQEAHNHQYMKYNLPLPDRSVFLYCIFVRHTLKEKRYSHLNYEPMTYTLPSNFGIKTVFLSLSETLITFFVILLQMFGSQGFLMNFLTCTG